MHKHWDWCEAIHSAYPDITKDNVHDILRHEVGQRFVTVLEHAGVFKRDKRGKDAFRRFLQHAVERMSSLV
jgi:UDPglucose--hexose-1-phosphate uridylyltransferase